MTRASAASRMYCATLTPADPASLSSIDHSSSLNRSVVARMRRGVRISSIARSG